MTEPAEHCDAIHHHHHRHDGSDEKNKAGVYYSLGRGGSGNIRSSPDVQCLEPKLEEPGEGTPELKQQYYTTGRGGSGNIRENVDPEITRLAQDVGVGNDEPNDPSKPDFGGSTSIGRGGYGNVRAAQEERKTVVQRIKELVTGHT